jgi:hypothetical protein
LAEAPDPPDPVPALRVAAIELKDGRTEFAAARVEKGLARAEAEALARELSSNTSPLPSPP